MNRARKLCPAPGCPNLMPCPDHKPVAWQGHSGRHGRMRSGSREQRRARGVLLRDNLRCYLCGGIASLVDHVIPLSEGGPDTWENCRAICEPCHDEKTQAEAQRARWPR